MFSRKSNKSTENPPNPPKIAEILEDLETFSMDHLLERPRQRLGEERFGTLSTSDTSINSIDSSKPGKRERNDSEGDCQLDEWWETFEKFLGDIDKLEIYQKQFEAKKRSLAKLDESIGLMSDEIHTRITDSLQKAMEQIPESEPDLK